ncbi:MAG: hypothetical protein GY782_05640 [Gammaproteobacteria bacterium]|nr:hypothetical protein [Gammaproteobacteria bacterium]
MKTLSQLLIALCLFMAVRFGQAATNTVDAHNQQLVKVSQQEAIALCNQALKSKATYGYRENTRLGSAASLIPDQWNENIFWFVMLPVSLQDEKGNNHSLSLYGYCCVDSFANRQDKSNPKKLVTQVLFSNIRPAMLHRNISGYFVSSLCGVGNLVKQLHNPLLTAH